MEIQRDTYLNKLIRSKNNGLIKIITGIRRCGKSYLLFNLFKKHLLEQGIPKEHIIALALDDIQNKEYRSPDKLYSYVKSQIKDENMYYLLLDEIQFVPEFEDVLNGFLHIDNADVYVTGSNSKFLSTDIVTEFRGRGYEIAVHPLSFAEYFSAYKGKVSEAWKDYYTYGGLPRVLSFSVDEEKMNYLEKLLQEVYIRDILEHNDIRNTSELEELVSLLASAVGSLTNPHKLEKTFLSVKQTKISAYTIKSYIDYFKDAFLVSAATRYDIKGKKYINTPQKYYFEDVGLRNAQLKFRQQEETHIIENIIFNELRIRGFNVDVGIVEVNAKQNERSIRKQLEVDFIANKGNSRYYVQSAFAMPSAEKRAQEERPLIKIQDSFKKIIVVGDDIKAKKDEKGILTIGITEFLLNENSLDI